MEVYEFKDKLARDLQQKCRIVMKPDVALEVTETVLVALSDFYEFEPDTQREVKEVRSLVQDMWDEFELLVR